MSDNTRFFREGVSFVASTSEALSKSESSCTVGVSPMIVFSGVGGSEGPCFKCLRIRVTNVLRLSSYFKPCSWRYFLLYSLVFVNRRFFSGIFPSLFTPLIYEYLKSLAGSFSNTFFGVSCRMSAIVNRLGVFGSTKSSDFVAVWPW